MYKYIGFIIIGLWAVSAEAAWTTENCTNRGGVIASASDGHEFCRSKKKMNFWSAKIWCQKHGGSLTHLEITCPGTPQNNEADCMNLHPITARLTVWIDNLVGEQQICIYNNGKSQIHPCTRTSEAYALCDQ